MPKKPQLTSMTVSLPTSQKLYVRKQAEATGCSTPSEYIRRLIHEDQTMRESTALEEQILSGIDSPKRSMPREEWELFKKSLRERASKAKKTKAAKRA